MKLSNSTTKTLTFLTFLFLQQLLAAQDVQREIGIRSNNFQDFGAVYKWQKAENIYRRLSAAFVNLNAGIDPDRVSVGIGVTYGKENRRSLADRTDFLYGLQWLVQGGYSDNLLDPNDPSASADIGISYLIGIQFHASSHFNIGLEFLPSLILRTRFNPVLDATLQGSANLSNAVLFATYRFSSPAKQPKK